MPDAVTDTKRTARNAGLMLNVCPWCGARPREAP